MSTEPEPFVKNPLNLLSLDQANFQGGWGIERAPQWGRAGGGGAPITWSLRFMPWTPLVPVDAPRFLSSVGGFTVANYQTVVPDKTRLLPYNPLAEHPLGDIGLIEVPREEWLPCELNTTYTVAFTAVQAANVSVKVTIYEPLTGYIIGGPYFANELSSVFGDADAVLPRIGVSFTSPDGTSVVNIPGGGSRLLTYTEVFVEIVFVAGGLAVPFDIHGIDGPTGYFPGNGNGSASKVWRAKIADPVYALGHPDPGALPPRRPKPAVAYTRPLITAAPLTTEWDFYAVDLTTGSILGDIPVSDPSCSVAIDGSGTFSGKIPIGGLSGDDQDRVYDWLQPGKSTVVVARNGLLVGEWIIWHRTRAASEWTFEISGSEIPSYLQYRLAPWAAFNTEKLDIAAAWLNYAFEGIPASWVTDNTELHGTGAIAVTVESPDPSGISAIVDTTNKWVSLASQISELASGQDGFEVLISSELMNTTAGIAYVERTARLTYPQAGVERDMTFEVAGPGYPPGNALGVSTDEDATLLASTVLLLGKLTPGVRRTSMNLLDSGFPFMERTETVAFTPETTGAMNDYADSMLVRAQSSIVPSGMTVLANVDPFFGNYGIGDTVSLNIEPSPVYPGGFTGRVRITAMAFTPKTGAETVQLTIAAAGQGMATRRSLAGGVRDLADRLRTAEATIAAMNGTIADINSRI